jgi:hypothetical protein
MSWPWELAQILPIHFGVNQISFWVEKLMGYHKVLPKTLGPLLFDEPLHLLLKFSFVLYLVKVLLWIRFFQFFFLRGTRVIIRLFRFWKGLVENQSSIFALLGLRRHWFIRGDLLLLSDDRLIELQICIDFIFAHEPWWIAILAIA